MTFDQSLENPPEDSRTIKKKTSVFDHHVIHFGFSPSHSLTEM